MRAKKQRINKAKRPASRIHYFKHHPFVLPVAVFLFLFFSGMVALIGLGGETLGPSDSRVVRLFVDGSEQVIPTRARTVEQLLDRLNIAVSKNDIVEPSVETEITDSGFEVNVYRARTVLVDDGEKERVIFTAEPTPERIAKQVGVTVHPEDHVTKVPADTVEPVVAVREGVVAEKVIIDRAVQASINLYGTVVMVRTHAGTVGELLSEKGITINEGDTLQPDLTALLTPQTQIFITRFGTRIEQVEEVIEPPTETVDDYELTLGTRRVREPGKPGKRIVTYEILVENDVETSRKVLQELIVEQPVTQVVARGRKAPVVAGNKAEIMAAAGISSSEFYAADYIISHESGWKVNAMNANGCAGLGQACPGSKLARACPNWESDPVCQMSFFNGYAVGRYGSWTNAFEKWQMQRWW
jgi:uncharacterized protein YabE (DUF348 family)